MDITLTDAPAFSVFAAASDAHSYQEGASKAPDADIVTLTAHQKNSESRQMKLTVIHAARKWPDYMRVFVPLKTDQFVVIGYLHHQMITFEITLEVNETTSVVTIMRSCAFLGHKQSLWSFLSPTNTDTPTELIVPPSAPDPRSTEAMGVTAEMLSRNIHDIPELAPHIEYLESAGIELLGELCMVIYRRTGGFYGKESGMTLARRALKEIGVPTEFHTSMIAWLPFYWDDPEFYRALNVPVENVMRGRWRSYLGNCGDVEDGITMGAFLNHRRLPYKEKEFNGQTGSWNIRVLCHRQQHIDHRSGLRAAMLIPPDWKP